MKKDYFVLGGVVVLLVLLFLYTRFAEPAPDLTYRPIEAEYGEITVEDQDDMSQVVLDVTLANAGWVTIHRAITDAPGQTVGVSRYLEPGTYEDLAIELDDTLPGWKHIALLRIDNGDKVFVSDEDFPVSVGGQVVRPDFILAPSQADTVFE